ncbi:hypothetical protein [Rhizobium ruizarguesonis]|uniref:hypothetical protein n=1 Tax=Rhizobium ruizarguesonis TaxID=2081791 RepID=UPI00103273D5|nr:hypothetical protein [Rhizobium ruizarguesonis]TBC88644.1 hypothetical protein ELH25_37200 [Rhizobium ruizarguesonis]TBD07777.1 hypothetical protein ELH24_37660 [Rhizobium ruizarguesonis]TBD24711.1 hypothetical protein ELH18_36870 [Rhizobium ruizarguesonis]TBD24955.1 hypothetical protein ELH19_36450 [Rhizobium ruizarguesonis]TBD34885.1 hypothetical protein ELH17_33660 [Rhizobium ruizarguesonis]
MTSSSYQIIVRNLSQTTQYFYVFQKQAAFPLRPSPDPILSGSLGCQSVGNYPTTGAQINFGLDSQVYAGALSTKQVSASQVIALLSLNAATLSVVGSTSAFRAVTLTTADGSSDNCTTLTLYPLGLSAPANQAGIAIGGFGINVPSYTPLPHPELYCGVVALNNNQAIILSSFVAPIPSTVMNCIPKQIFFVKMGYQPVGSTVAYDESNAACCDFTIGYATYTVTYIANGTFSATGGP